MTCPRCGTKTRSKIVCPTCGQRSRRPYWLLLIPLAAALVAFVTFVGNAYFDEMLRSTDSLANKVSLKIGDDTASADEASTVDFESLQKSMYSVSYGAGFLISPRDVLTAASNVAGLRNIIMYHDGKSVSGTVVGRTKQVAVIRIAETDATPFLFTQAIASESETLVTLTMKEQINGSVTFSGNHYSRHFDLPRHAIGSPLVSTSGRVVAIHLRGIAVPTAVFEQDVRSFLEADLPVPPPVDLAPVAPITPDSNEVPKTTPKQAPEADDSAEQETPVTEEPPVEEPTEESTEPEVTPEEPEEPAEPTEPPAPPETDEPVEDDPPTSEPEEPTEPTEPTTDEHVDDLIDDTLPEEDENQTSTPSV